MQIAFSKIKPGEKFQWNSNIYVKVKHPHGYKTNCVLINSSIAGGWCHFEDCTDVTPLYEIDLTFGDLKLGQKFRQGKQTALCVRIEQIDNHGSFHRAVVLEGCTAGHTMNFTDDVEIAKLID